MIIRIFYTPGLSIYTYFIGDGTTHRAVVVDPTRDVEPYLAFANESKFEITDIAETHVHADFVSGAKELKHRLQGKPQIHCSALGGPEWTPKYCDIKVQNGSDIKLGNICLRALHTPGHTPEHIVWLCYEECRSKETPCIALTGDLLFVGGVGRSDLLGKKAMKSLSKQLYASLFDELLRLPEYLEVFPAHGAGSLCGKGLSSRPSSTLGYEKLFNPLLKKLPLEKWIENLQEDVPAQPKNFSRLKKINIAGAPLLCEVKPTQEEAAFIIDVRNPELFAKKHVKDSVNIPLLPPFCNWVGMVLEDEVPLGVIGETAEQIEQAIKNLKLIGFDNLVLKAVWDEKSLGEKYDLTSLNTVDVSSFVNNIKDSYIVDVRAPAEWKSGHIPEAHHYELGRFLENANSIPKDKPIYVLCATGYRASMAASLLQKLQYENVSNVRGGMIALQEAKL